MKTSTLSFQNTSIYYIVGFLSVLLASCGSYQNSSYYDSDGIYGNTANRAIVTETQNAPNNDYKDYFGSLQNTNQPVEIFTDVDNYNDYSLENDTLQNNNPNYPGWGSNPQTVNVNIYDTGWAMNNWYGNNWGWNGGYGWGMNNWYGNNWGWNGGFGWGMNVGFGWNNWGWNNFYGNNWGWNNWYGNNWGYSNYNNNSAYSHNPGRRGSSYANSVNSNRNSGNYNRTQSTTINRRAVKSEYRGNNATDFGRGSSGRLNRTSPTFSRNQVQSQNNSNYNPVRRGNTTNARNESNAPSRSYTPAARNANNSRSYTPSSSSSSSRSSNSGGGGRSSGGRGGRV